MSSKDRTDCGDHHVDRPHFTCNQPLLYLFLSVLPSFLPASHSPAHSLIGVHSSTDPPPLSSTLTSAKSGFACSFLIVHQLLWLTGLFLVFVSVTFVCQVCVSVCSYLRLPSFLIIPFLHWNGPWLHTLKGADGLSFHTPLEFSQWVAWTTWLFLAGFKRRVQNVESEFNSATRYVINYKS